MYREQVITRSTVRIIQTAVKIKILATKKKVTSCTCFTQTFKNCLAVPPMPKMRSKESSVSAKLVLHEMVAWYGNSNSIRTFRIVQVISSSAH